MEENNAGLLDRRSWLKKLFVLLTLALPFSLPRLSTWLSAPRTMHRRERLVTVVASPVVLRVPLDGVVTYLTVTPRSEGEPRFARLSDPLSVKAGQELVFGIFIEQPQQ